MAGKKSEFGLIIKLLIALAAGALLGRVAGVPVMDAVVSVKYALGQIIFFVVPLVIIGFIAPAIIRLGRNASKMLFVAVALAYLSSIGAASFSAISGYIIIPHLSVPTQIQDLVALPKPSFVLDIPPLMTVMSALVTALLLGIAAAWTRAETISRVLTELEGIMTAVVTRIVIPLLPFFVGATFCELSYEGRLTVQLPIFLKIIGLVIIGHYIWLAVLYALGGAVSGRNPGKVLRYYLPAYLTAVGTMSSAATLPVSLSCARRSPVLSRTITEFMIPLGATVHLCGSVLTETFFIMTISLMLYGSLPSVGLMALFIVLFGVFAVGAPGVPGGTVMASLGLVISVLHFDPAGVALLLAIFALQDSFGTACNVTGDGALALMLEGLFNREQQLDSTFGTGE
ncbi:dicarboxylate/amino acid:cation symporter [uncultured Mailhella sp.]|uniref:dicarboxylate/amino acid:cation symporter n=1 Tax=uncultured Mailhella sp. TaxID=1981031 RepID=UPI00260D8942|nr:dicarboxylate/amino acid:cation symporter [uncultured Mailhella sp.]